MTKIEVEVPKVPQWLADVLEAKQEPSRSMFNKRVNWHLILNGTEESEKWILGDGNSDKMDLAIALGKREVENDAS